MSEVAAPAAPVSADVPAPVSPDASKASAAPATGSADKSADLSKTPAETPAQAEKRKLKLKVDGEESEWEGTDEDIVRELQKAKAADKRFREASETKKAIEAQRNELNNILLMMKENPQAFAEGAKKLGVDPLKLAEQILLPAVQAQIEADQEKEMTPEQLEALKTKRELEQYKQREKAEQLAKQKAEEDAKTAQYQAKVEQAANEFGEKVMKALEQTKLPKTDETALELLNLAEEAYRRGLETDPKYLAQDLERRKAAEVNALRNPDMLDPAFKKEIMLLAKNDPEIRELIRKEMVAEFREKNPLLQQPEVQKNRSDREVPKDEPRKKKQTHGAILRDVMLMAHSIKK